MLTVYGIETMALELACEVATYELQQCLPFTVLKLLPKWLQKLKDTNVATVLTVYGIETLESHIIEIFIIPVATVLTVYGIETGMPSCA